MNDFAQKLTDQIDALKEPFEDRKITEPPKLYVNQREAELLRMTEDMSDETFDRYFAVYEEVKNTPEDFDKAMMLARMAVQFPNMPAPDLKAAVDMYLLMGQDSVFDDLLAQAEEDEKAELFDMFADFERIREMRAPKPPVLNRAERRAQAKRAKQASKPQPARRPDKPRVRPLSTRQNEVPVSHADDQHKDAAKEYTQKNQRERLADMYEDLADPNYEVPKLPADALDALADYNKENAR